MGSRNCTSYSLYHYGAAGFLVRTKKPFIDYINEHSFVCIWIHHICCLAKGIVTLYPAVDGYLETTWHRIWMLELWMGVSLLPMD